MNNSQKLLLTQDSATESESSSDDNNNIWNINTSPRIVLGNSVALIQLAYSVLYHLHSTFSLLTLAL